MTTAPAPDPDRGPVDPPVDLLDLREFVDAGLVQEINRRLLHPLGMAIEWDTATDAQALDIRAAVRAAVRKAANGIVGVSDHDRLVDAVDALVAETVPSLLMEPGTVYLAGVWDDRADPLGTRYLLPADMADEGARRARLFDAEWLDRADIRKAKLGYMVQPTRMLGDPS